MGGKHVQSALFCTVLSPPVLTVFVLVLKQILARFMRLSFLVHLLSLIFRFSVTRRRVLLLLALDLLEPEELLTVHFIQSARVTKYTGRVCTCER